MSPEGKLIGRFLSFHHVLSSVWLAPNKFMVGHRFDILKEKVTQHSGLHGRSYVITWRALTTSTITVDDHVTWPIMLCAIINLFRRCSNHNVKALRDRDGQVVNGVLVQAAR